MMCGPWARALTAGAPCRLVSLMAGSPASCSWLVLSLPRQVSPSLVNVASLGGLQAAAVSRAKDPYKFMWADGNCLTDFADAFDVQV